MGCMEGSWQEGSEGTQPVKLSIQASHHHPWVCLKAAVLTTHHTIIGTATLWLLTQRTSCPRLSYPYEEQPAPLVTSLLSTAACGALEVGWPTSAPSCSIGRWWG